MGVLAHHTDNAFLEAPVALSSLRLSPGESRDRSRFKGVLLCFNQKKSKITLCILYLTMKNLTLLQQWA